MAESSVSIWLQTEATLKEVEFHVMDAKRQIERLKQQIADFELPNG